MQSLISINVKKYIKIYKKDSTVGNNQVSNVVLLSFYNNFYIFIKEIFYEY